MEKVFDLTCLPLSVIQDPGFEDSVELHLLSRSLPLFLHQRLNDLGLNTVFLRLISRQEDAASWIVTTDMLTTADVQELFEKQEIESHYALMGSIRNGKTGIHLRLKLLNLSADYEIFDETREFPREAMPAAAVSILRDICKNVDAEIDDDAVRGEIIGTANTDAFLRYLSGRDCVEAYIYQLDVSYPEHRFDDLLLAMTLDHNYQDPLEALKAMLAFQVGELEVVDDASVAAAERAIEFHDRDPQLFALLATLYEMQERFDAATLLWERCAECCEQPAEAWFRAGAAIENTQDFQAALDFYKKSLAADPDFLDSYDHAGICHAQLDQLEEAIRCWEEVLARSPDKSAAYGNLGMAHLMLGDEEKAEACYVQGLAQPHAFWNVYHNYQQLLLKQQRWAELETMSDNNLKHHDHDPFAYFHRAFARHHLHRDEEATNDLFWVMGLEGDGPLYDKAASLLEWTAGKDVLEGVTIGCEQALGGDAALAALALDKLCERYGAAWVLWYHLAQARLRDNDAAGAATALGKVVELFPEHSDALNELGMVSLKLHHFADARKHLEAAVKDCPDDPVYLCNLAQVYISINEYQAASACLRDARRIAPDEPRLEEVQQLLVRSRCA